MTLSICQFTGSAPKVAQVLTLTPLELSIGALVRLYFAEAPGHYIEYECTTAVAADWVTAMVELWNDSLDPLFAEGTAEASGDGGAVVITADTAGNPLCTLAASVGGTKVAAVSEVNTLTLPSAPTVPSAGTFQLTFGGYTTAGLNHNANAAQIQAALVALTSVGAGGFTVAGTGPFTIYAGGTLANQNLGAMTAISHLLGVGTITPSVVRDGITGTDEIQQIAIPGEATGGTFALSFRGATTANLAYDANSAQIQTALETLSTIGTGNVAVTGTVTAGTFLVTFQDARGSEDVPPLTALNGLAGEVLLDVTVQTEGGTQNEKQTVTFAFGNSAGNGGTFQLVFDGQTTGSIAYSDSGNTAAVQSALDALSNIGAGNSLVTDGYPAINVVVEFIGTLAAAEQPTFTVINHITRAIAPTLACTKRQDGAAGSDGAAETSRFDYGSAAEWYVTDVADSFLAGPLTSSSTAAEVAAAMPSHLGVTEVSAGVVDIAYSAVGVATELTGTGSGLSVTRTVEGVAAVAAKNETYDLTWTTLPDSGTFSLQFGAATAYMNYNAVAATIQSALESLGTIGAGNVSVTGPVGTWVVQFVGAFAGSDVSTELVAANLSLNYHVAVSDPTITRTQEAGDTDEVQVLQSTGEPNAGTYALTFDGETTAAIAWNAPASTVRNELAALTNVGGTANILVEGDDLLTGLTLTFTEALGSANQPTVTVASALQGGRSIAVSTITEGINGQNAKQLVTIPTTAAGGSYQLEVSVGGLIYTTSAIAWNAAPADVSAALRSITTIAANDLSVTGTTGAAVVEFKGQFSGVTMPLMTSVNAITPGSVTLPVTQLQVGEAGVDEIQTLTVKNASGGYWLIGQMTTDPEAGRIGTWRYSSIYVPWVQGDTGTSAAPLAYNATADEVQTALKDINVNATVTRDDSDASQMTYTLIFNGVDKDSPQRLVVGCTIARWNANNPTWQITGYDDIENERFNPVVFHREVVGGPAVAEIQHVQPYGSAGTYTLSFNGQTTTGIAFNANAPAVQAALEALSTIDPGDVTVADATNQNEDWWGVDVTFGGTLTGDQPDFGWSAAWMTPRCIPIRHTVEVAAQSGVDAIHSIFPRALTAYGAIHLGFATELFSDPADRRYGWPNYTIYTTSPVHYNDLADDVRLKFNYPDDLEITGGPLGVAPLVIHFKETWGNQPLPLYLGGRPCWFCAVATDAGVGGGDWEFTFYSTRDGQEPRNQKEYMHFETAPTAGTYTVSFGGYTTSTIAYNATETQVENALCALRSIGTRNVEVTGSHTRGGFHLTYIGALETQAIGPCTSASGMTNGSETVSVQIREMVKGRVAANEVQTLTFVAKNPSGTFRIVPGTGSVSNLSDPVGGPPWTAAGVQAALEVRHSTVVGGLELPFYGKGNVAVTGPNGGPFTITFQNDCAETDIGLLGFANSNGTAGEGLKIPYPEFITTRDKPGAYGTSALQYIDLPTTTAAGGTWYVGYDGTNVPEQSVGFVSIAYDATADDVRNALGLMFGYFNILVTKTDTATGTRYGVTFQQELASEPMDAMTAWAEFIDPAIAPVITETQKGFTAGNEQQLITAMTGLTAGTWTITFDGKTSPYLTHNASVADVQAALNYSWGVGAITAGGTVGAWTLDFVGPYANTDVDPVVIDYDVTALLSDPVIATTTQGDHGTIVDIVTTTPNRSPSDWIDTANWSGETLPVAGDGIVLKDCSVPICWNLPDGTSGVRYAYVHQYQSQTGAIGLPRINTSGSEPYREVRQQKLALEADEWKFGIGDGPGAHMINAEIVNSGGNASTVTVYNTGYSDDGSRPTLVLSGNTGTGGVWILKGSVGLQYYPEESFSTAAVYTGNSGQVEADVTLWIGENVTVALVIQYGGYLVSHSTITTHTMWGGQAKYLGGTPVTMNITGTAGSRAVLVYSTPNGATTLKVGAYGTVQFGQDLRPVTITTITIAAGGKINDPTNRLSYSTCDHPEYINTSDSTNLLPGDS